MLDIVNTLLKDKYVPKDTHSPIARFSTSHEHHLDREDNRIVIIPAMATYIVFYSYPSSCHTR